jgi:hypothetical protein|nr:MAG TPA: hypothetical protein [Caudoviricetes sp.]
MRRVRRILVALLVLLICIVIQKGLSVFNAAAIVIDAVVVIVLAVIELRRK